MRVLVVEDERDIADFLRKGLEAEYFSVDIASEGERGSYLARTNDYDLIILDNLLPKKCGPEICSEVRASGRSVPILMLSVQSDVPKKIELLNSGADDYMAKPFSMGEVVARARALIRRPRAVQNDPLRVGDLELDSKSCRAERGGKRIPLTRREFELLEYLMRNKGRVLTRGMIMEHVWDINADPFSNTIETHILNLRKKVEARGRDKLIHTVSGRGYKIDDGI